MFQSLKHQLIIAWYQYHWELRPGRQCQETSFHNSVDPQENKAEPVTGGLVRPFTPGCPPTFSVGASEYI